MGIEQTSGQGKGTPQSFSWRLKEEISQDTIVSDTEAIAIGEEKARQEHARNQLSTQLAKIILPYESIITDIATEIDIRERVKQRQLEEEFPPPQQPLSTERWYQKIISRKKKVEDLPLVPEKGETEIHHDTLVDNEGNEQPFTIGFHYEIQEGERRIVPNFYQQSSSEGAHSKDIVKLSFSEGRISMVSFETTDSVHFSEFPPLSEPKHSWEKGPLLRQGAYFIVDGEEDSPSMVVSKAVDCRKSAIVGNGKPLPDQEWRDQEAISIADRLKYNSEILLEKYIGRPYGPWGGIDLNYSEQRFHAWDDINFTHLLGPVVTRIPLLST